MVVYAAKPWANHAVNTKIRNFKFKTEQDAKPSWFVPDGSDCWNQCNGQAGSCDHCGPNGFCCSADSTKVDFQGDCTKEMIDTIKNSIYGDTTYHMCVARRDEDSCSDWIIGGVTNISRLNLKKI